VKYQARRGEVKSWAVAGAHVHGATMILVGVGFLTLYSRDKRLLSSQWN